MTSDHRILRQIARSRHAFKPSQWPPNLFASSIHMLSAFLVGVLEHGVWVCPAVHLYTDTPPCHNVPFSQRGAHSRALGTLSQGSARHNAHMKLGRGQGLEKVRVFDGLVEHMPKVSSATMVSRFPTDWTASHLSTSGQDIFKATFLLPVPNSPTFPMILPLHDFGHICFTLPRPWAHRRP